MYIHPLYHWPPKSLWRATPGSTRTWSDMSVYIHFPFCRNICSFCNYETRLIDRRSAEQWALNVHREIDEYLSSDDFSSVRIQSLFFGGGTASLIPTDVLGSLVKTLASVNESGVIPEVTLECEPGTVDRRRLEEASVAGVNRVGVCAQSFDDEMLKRLTRRHTASDALDLVESALAVGIDNIHLDLMYGLPGQDLDHWRRTLETAVELPFTHISAYKLYVFLHGQIQRDGTAPRPQGESDEHTAMLDRMNDLTVSILGEAGFDQYSLTEYAQPGRICDYLQRTFDGGDVLPLGPSSFGRCGAEVWQNSGLVQAYGDGLEWKAARTAYQLTAAEAFKRDVILGLWLLRVDLNKQQRRHGVSASEGLRELIAQMRGEGLLGGHDDVIDVGPHQRFCVGEVMQRLAGLDTLDWIASEVPEAPMPASAAPVSESVMSILRIARRDPAFFTSLSSDPNGALAGLTHSLTQDETEQLVVAITGGEHEPVRAPDPLAEAWSATQREFRRRQRQRQ